MNDNFSCIKEVTKIVNLNLPSMYNTNEISGICDALESWKRQYVNQLQGIVVGYKNVSLTSKRGYLKADCPVIYCNVKATFELFYPTIGSIIKGKVNRISQDHIGCLVHNTINVTVHRTADISEDIDKFIILDSFILFQITRINLKSKFIHVKGKITEECITLMKESGLFSVNENVNVSNNDALICSSPDFSSSSIVNTPISYNNDTQGTGNLDLSTDTSSQTSSHKKKKKHKKSKEKSLMSPSLISGSFENDVVDFELIQSSDNTKKKKHKKSDSNAVSHANAEENNNLFMKDADQGKSTQSSDNTRKRKRKKSDVTLSSPTNALNNETESIHPKKKMRRLEQNFFANNTIDFPENNPAFMSSSICSSGTIYDTTATTPKVCSSNIDVETENLVVKSELLSPVKKKKHKKSKHNSDVTSLSSDPLLTTEINLTDSTSSLHISPQKFSPNSLIKPKNDRLTSPDLFDDSISLLKSETEPIKPKTKKKKKENVLKSKTHKKKKDRLKKSSKKRRKERKTKVISTKKKIHGKNAKLKKKKIKDEKSVKVRKIKTEKIKKEPK